MVAQGPPGGAPAFTGPPPPFNPNVDNVQSELIALLWIFPALSGLVVAVRIWRKRIDHTLGLDDALIVIAWLLAMVHSVVSTVYVQYTYVGYHMKDVPVWLIDWIYAWKIQYALSVCYIPIICTVKASFMWSLQRLRSRNTWIVRSLWFWQIFNLLNLIGAFTATLVPCRPLSRKWDKSVPGTCYDDATFVIANVTIAMVTDIIVLAIPTWMIYDLQMPLKKKLITIAFLSMGIIVMVISVFRLIWLVNILKGIMNNHSVETCYSAVESNVAILGASGPTLKYIFGFIIPGLKGSMQKKSSSNNYPSGYGTNNSASRRTKKTYGDLDSDSIEEHVEVEMKSDYQWRQKDSDARSDEQRMTGNNDRHEIMKTVDWNVTNSDGQRQVPGSPAVQPATTL